jgi:hypothetical protein
MKKTILLVILLSLLAACNRAPAATPVTTQPPEPYPAEATEGGLLYIPQASGGATQEAYPSASGTVEPTALLITSGVAKIYLIALEDKGASGKLIGCDDSVVPVEIMVDPGADALRAALEILLGLKDQYYGQSGLYNALYQSNLQIDKIEIEPNELKVELVGTVMLGGVCDNPRFSAQLTETVAQFAEGREVKIEINDESLDEFLSQQ